MSGTNGRGIQDEINKLINDGDWGVMLSVNWRETALRAWVKLERTNSLVQSLRKMHKEKKGMCLECNTIYPCRTIERLDIYEAI